MRNRDAYLKAMKLRAIIRSFFVSRGYLECETPILVCTPGLEANLFPFETELITFDGQTARAGLITSPEFSLKKILGPDFPKIFELARVFRNHEPRDATHNPEFTLLEWYQISLDYQELMTETEELIKFCARSFGSEKVKISGREIDLSRGFERLTVSDAFYKYCGFHLSECLDKTTLAIQAAKLGIKVESADSYDDIFFRIFLSKIESALGFPDPVFLYDYPASMAALARRKPEDARFAERFELYIGGVELANAYGELCDPEEQRIRFERDTAKRRVLGKTIFPIDERLLAELAKIGQASGIALGVDRLAMILSGASHLDEVLAFGAGELFD